MKTFTYTIKDAVGIHARPAGLLVKLVKSLDSTVTITKGDKSVNASQLMKLMGMGIKCGDTVNFTIEGGNEDASAKAVEDFMNENL
ncbi:MAG: HPr family phosphocarrier protein [Ruminococcus sp.]|jgi:phosphocarrier protein|nr:HPr family phosphocarrier protein [Ruminococcus sp.]